MKPQARSRITWAAVCAVLPSVKLGAQERDPLQREMRLSFHVTTADTHGPRPWTGVLLSCLCAVLLSPQRKHLRRYWRRPER